MKEKRDKLIGFVILILLTNPSFKYDQASRLLYTLRLCFVNLPGAEMRNM